MKEEKYSWDDNPEAKVNTVMINVEAKASETLDGSLTLLRRRRALKTENVSMIINVCPTDLLQVEVVPCCVWLVSGPPVQAECDQGLAQAQQTGGQADVNIVGGQGAPLHRGKLGLTIKRRVLSGYFGYLT